MNYCPNVPVSKGTAVHNGVCIMPKILINSLGCWASDEPVIDDQSVHRPIV